ncbi:Zinc finger CCCH domain-containing protein [Drosera capensis]
MSIFPSVTVPLPEVIEALGGIDEDDDENSAAEVDAVPLLSAGTSRPDPLPTPGRHPASIPMHLKGIVVGGVSSTAFINDAVHWIGYDAKLPTRSSAQYVDNRVISFNLVTEMLEYFELPKYHGNGSHSNSKVEYDGLHIYDVKTKELDTFRGIGVVEMLYANVHVESLELLTETYGLAVNFFTKACEYESFVGGTSSRNFPDASISEPRLRISVRSSCCSSPSLSSSPVNGFPCSSIEAISSPVFSKSSDHAANLSSEKRDYPIDPSFPDIKNSIIYEFRVFTFKIRPCSRAYSHDWTECPFVHPGEETPGNTTIAVFYVLISGNLHVVEEICVSMLMELLSLGSIQLNTAPGCVKMEPVELRPLYLSTGSAVPTATAGVGAMDMACIESLPWFTFIAFYDESFPIFAAANVSSYEWSFSNGAWPSPSVPTIHLPGSNLQSSRLRASLSARD